MAVNSYVIPFEQLGIHDIAQVGGKNASLGEMIRHLTNMGVKVPGGFATTAAAFHEFLRQGSLNQRIQALLMKLNVDDLFGLQEIGLQIRSWILDSSLQPELIDALQDGYKRLGPNTAVAVRSSATAEDLPDASFAGQQETFLNVCGFENILNSVKAVFASLYTDRAISYRVHKGFKHEEVALSVGIQKMVRSDLASSGVMFTLDTESGFNQVVFITSSYGLGELIVQGAVNPDEFYVYKPSLCNQTYPILRKSLGSKAQKMVFGSVPSNARIQTINTDLVDQNKFSLTDDDIIQLAHLATKIEDHYGCAMDIEWAKDGNSQELYIVQARPETVHRQNARILERYELLEQGKLVATGRSIGQKIGQGKAKIINAITQIEEVQSGDILVTDMTDPDWEPIMKKVAAIITNRGGRTCHAAIIARELGIPAIVGTHDATQTIQNHQEITVSCAQGDTGFVYEGSLPFRIHKINLEQMPTLPFKIMMNVANPDRAFNFSRLPNQGVGLARLEFIISQMIGIHPKACLEFDKLPSALKQQIQTKSAGYTSARHFYVEKLAEGISILAAAFYPKPVIIRFSDFKSNEYANLLGGKLYEPVEENPMLGFRGASRYLSEKFVDAFQLEVEAIQRVRNLMGFKNIEVMVPFVRTVEEAKAVVDLLEYFGLKRGVDGLRIIMMCELPSNALLADQFLQYFDGFSIGSNDLTQLTLGLDRDSGLIAHHFDERNAAVKILLKQAIEACKRDQKYIGICGQGPSDHKDFAQWLVEQGIESISLNPDSVLETWLLLAKGITS